MDSSTWSKYSEPDAELQAILKTSPPMRSFADYGTAQNLRDSILQQFGALIQAGIFKLVDWTGYNVSEIQIPTRDGAQLRAIAYRSNVEAANGDGAPVLVYFHGGGWTFGGPEAGEKYFESLVKDMGMVVVSVGYRVAPEKTFPTAAEDGIDAVRWVAENGKNIGADTNKGFIVAGTSAGGNVAAVAAHQAVDDGLKPGLTGVVLMYPGLCHPDGMPEAYKPHHKSYEEFKDAVILDKRGMEFFYEQYRPDPKSPLASPLLWHTHKGQPPTYLQVMGVDPLRDESLIYEHVIREQGVPTKLEVFPGIPHGGPDFLPMHSCSKKAVEGLSAGVAWILKQK